MQEMLLSLTTVFQLGAFLLSPMTVEELPKSLVFQEEPVTNQGMLLTLNIPSIDNTYYQDDWEDIVAFHSQYAAVIESPDRVKVLVDSKTRPLVEASFESGVLETFDVDDIWMRDFTMINPYNPIQFAYGGGLWPDNAADARYIQRSFNKYAQKEKLKFRTTDYVLDGGNIVDNYDGKIITTDRFLDDNDLDYEEGKSILAELYGAEAVAILPADDEALGHSDGMVMWADTDVILVNKYQGRFKKDVWDELSYSFPNVKIVEVEADFDDAIYDEAQGIGSACGINLNATMTEKNIYVPTFGMTAADKKFLQTLKANTTKKVITVDARGVCKMGGSVRCLTWQRAN